MNIHGDSSVISKDYVIPNLAQFDIIQSPQVKSDQAENICESFNNSSSRIKIHPSS